MNIVASVEEMNLLIAQGVVKNNGSQYTLCINSIEIPLEVSNSLATVIKTVEESDVDKILRAFPSIAEANKLLSSTGLSLSRNLRTGRKDVMLKKLKALSVKYSVDTLVQIIKHEVNTRVKQSNSRDNKLHYMKGSEAWLNDDANIEAVYEDMTTSIKPKQSNIDDNFKF